MTTSPWKSDSRVVVVNLDVNLHTLVKFKPTAQGEYIMQTRGIDYTLDADGNACMLLWEVMNTFGSVLTEHTTQHPFCANQITLVMPTEVASEVTDPTYFDSLLRTIPTGAGE